jgi:hypothetical protein
MNASYDVCFAGKLCQGQELSTVRKNIQKLFNADPDTLNKLFSGKTQLVKRGCDKATAEKYRKAMEHAGATAIIRARDTAPAQTAPPPTADSESDAAFNLAPAGSDVLRPDERKVEPISDVDIPDVTLTELGTDLGDHQESSVIAPDTSHLSVAEAGENIPNLPSADTPLTPNTDQISLSPQGTDFTDCAPPEPESPALDLSKIEMASVGSDVLEEQYRKKDQNNAPDTDHITLED